MKYRLIVFLAFCVSMLLLTSCNSFNHISIVETAPASPEKAPIKPAPRAVSNLCPAYQLPHLLKTPELPIRELEKIAPSDTDALESIERHHIEELRVYIAKLKTQLIESHAEYLVKCRNYREQHAQ